MSLSLDSLGLASLLLGPCQSPWHLAQSISRVSELLGSQRLPRGGGAGELPASPGWGRGERDMGPEDPMEQEPAW